MCIIFIVRQNEVLSLRKKIFALFARKGNRGDGLVSGLVRYRSKGYEGDTVFRIPHPLLQSSERLGEVVH